MFYVHSRCCDAHWELVYHEDTHAWTLACAKCGKGPGPGIKIKGPKLKAPKCACCQREDAQG